MSFRCQGCNQPQPTGVAPDRTVTKVRTVRDLTALEDREEVAEEKNFCESCAAPYKAAEAERLAERYKNVTIGSGLA